MNKRKLTTEEKRRRKERKAAFVTVFINGRQKRVRRVPLIDGIPADEFLAQNADPLWLHQNGMWELMPLDVETKAAEDALSLPQSPDPEPPDPEPAPLDHKVMTEALIRQTEEASGTPLEFFGPPPPLFE